MWNKISLRSDVVADVILKIVLALITTRSRITMELLRVELSQAG